LSNRKTRNASHTITDHAALGGEHVLEGAEDVGRLALLEVGDGAGDDHDDKEHDTDVKVDRL